MDQFFTGIVFPVLVVLPIALLIMIQPDNSTTIILMGIVFSMLFIGGAKLMQFFTTILLGASSMLIFIINQKSYVLKRILSFIDPTSSEAIGYQSTQSLLALQQVGFLCRGWGDSVEKHQYLPEPHTEHSSWLNILTDENSRFSRSMLKNFSDDFGVFPIKTSTAS